MLKLNTAMLVMLFGLTISTTSVVASAAQNVTAEQAYAADAGKFYTQNGEEVTWTYDESSQKYQLVVGTLTIKANRAGLARIKNTPYFRKTDLNSNDFEFFYNNQECTLPEVKQSVYFVSKLGIRGNYFQIRAETVNVKQLTKYNWIEKEVDTVAVSYNDFSVTVDVQKTDTRVSTIYSLNAFKIGDARLGLPVALSKEAFARLLTPGYVPQNFDFWEVDKNGDKVFKNVNEANTYPDTFLKFK